MNGWPIVTTDDPARLIHAPLGVPGSGRVRYGAAMALYTRGGLSAEALEVYREAAASNCEEVARGALMKWISWARRSR